MLNGKTTISVRTKPHVKWMKAPIMFHPILMLQLGVLPKRTAEILHVWSLHTGTTFFGLLVHN